MAFRSFAPDPSGLSTQQSAREGDQDDLVLAVALPLWTSETFLKPRARRRRVQEPELVPSYVHSSYARDLSTVAPAGYTLLPRTPIPRGFGR